MRIGEGGSGAGGWGSAAGNISCHYFARDSEFPARDLRVSCFQILEISLQTTSVLRTSEPDTGNLLITLPQIPSGPFLENLHSYSPPGKSTLELMNGTQSLMLLGEY